MQNKVISKQREKIIPFAKGRVLEIGIGSGLNFSFYNKSEVKDVFAVEPDNVLLEKAKKRALDNNIDLNIEKISAESLPYDNEFFDTIISTYTMCSISNLSSALNEIRRVLKKDGIFLFSEHGKSPDKNIYKWQKRLNPIQGALFGGCQLDVDIPNTLSMSNFDFNKINSMYVPGPKFLSYHYWGTAIKK
ncbi:MAG: SAM-dependent methyltransferase [Pelagibacteraceae bacterium]|nr:SAM-dependent methyltransferase [Pelagibacteraceae bacterium]|tara:strand:+ start:4341 stop:4910 length:570 start_codon:yes stop_codon:yes gene_type:complete